MATKASILSSLSDGFNSVVSNTGTLTDAEKVLIFNKALEVFKTVDPAKGGITVKTIAVFE